MHNFAPPTHLPSPRQACVVESQLLCLGSTLPTATSTNRKPSAHLCQLPAHYSHAAEFLKRAVPLCRWRSRLLQLGALERLPTVSVLGGTAHAIVIHHADEEDMCGLSPKPSRQAPTTSPSPEPWP